VGPLNWKSTITRASAATLIGLVAHFAFGYWKHFPFLTDVVAEWIMARTPSSWAVPLLESMGSWAKPFAATGGLASLGFVLWLALMARSRWVQTVVAVSFVTVLAWSLNYTSVEGVISFLVPAIAALISPIPLVEHSGSRREFLTSAAMTSGTVLVAVEAWWRNERLAARAVEPVPLFTWGVSDERQQWGRGLVRKPVTPVREFYVMSKNTVDPLVDPKTWRLKIRFDNRVVSEFSYSELLSLPRKERFITLRCVSNTLKSDLMGTAAWSGIELSQLVQASEIPAHAVEMAVIGLDGHGDSLRLDYAFSGEPLFAMGMNGNTLSRNHGYPIRMLTPSYYGFKSIKWIDEIRFSSVPYFGTWPKLGFTKEPLIHTTSFVDKVKLEGSMVQVGGVSFAGSRGIQRVELRADQGPWSPVELEASLSQYCWTRWKGELRIAAGAQFVEARAMDGEGKWQASVERPLFPDGVSGPTLKRLPQA